MTSSELAKVYQAPLNFDFTPSDNISAFSHPLLPVVTAPHEISLMSWGLVPSWIKDHESANQIRNKTINARSESIFEKSSFRNSITHQRCIVPVTSYHEWHHNEDKSKIKYDISPRNCELFSLAGIWSLWTGPESGKQFYSYSIITCPANPMMAEIHNTKQRMPVILPKESESYWLDPNLNRDSIQALMKQYPQSEMKADALL